MDRPSQAIAALLALGGVWPISASAVDAEVVRPSRLYAAPGVNAPRLGNLPVRAIVAVLDPDLTASYVKVRTLDGTIGFVYHTHLLEQVGDDDDTEAEEVNAGGDLRITFVDVGEGDAILLQRGELDVLVDAGSTSSDRYLKDALDSVEGPLEFFVLTHPHIDHYGGAEGVLERKDVLHVVSNGEGRGPPRDPEASVRWQAFLDAVDNEGLTIAAARVGQSLVDQAGLTIRPLWTGGHFPDTRSGENINNDSVVLLVEYAGRRVLLTGDIEVAADMQLMKDLCPHGPNACSALACDVLKVPHHGSADFDPDFFRAARPTWAVVSAAYRREDPHRLPRVNALLALRALGVRVVSTSAEGPEPVSLTIRADGEMQWRLPSNPAFFWEKSDDDGFVEVEVPQGQK